MWMPRECTEATQVSVRWLQGQFCAKPQRDLVMRCDQARSKAFPLLFTPASFVALSGRAKEKYKPLEKKLKIDQCVATKREARPSPCSPAVLPCTWPLLRPHSAFFVPKETG